VANGGAGIHVVFPDGETSDSSAPTGKYCTNYRAEAEALMQAASTVHARNDSEQVVFFTDALSVLQAYQHNKLPSLTEALRKVAHGRRVVLQWIQAHCGIPGIEQADRLAKEGASREQPSSSVSYSEMRSAIRTLTMPARNRDDYHMLTREQQSVLVRLRTGHNRLNCHLHRKTEAGAITNLPLLRGRPNSGAHPPIMPAPPGYKIQSLATGGPSPHQAPRHP
jgi:ribonuclease HI